MDPAAMQVLHFVLQARKKGSAETVSLPGADLRGAQLLRADLIGAKLGGAGLDHAGLAGAKLGGADLEAALLRWADLGGADLSGAKLKNADLSFARLEGALLVDADLRGACVAGAVGEPASVAGARIDKSMCDRSSVDDEDVIQLWRGGALIDDLVSFSEVVQRACAEAVSEREPHSRELALVERQALRQRLQQDDHPPHAARALVEMRPAALHAEEPGALSQRSLKLVAGILTPAMLRTPEWSQGDTVLGVKLEAWIGRGNNANVWRGHDGTGTERAVKLFDTERAAIGLSLPAYRRGVAVQNRLTARSAEVPGAVRIHCCSVNKLGFVMDLAKHGSAALLPERAWTLSRRVAFFENLCASVAAAHAVGALHRCLKPANVLLDDDLNPLLGDFDLVDLPTLAAESANAGGYRGYAAPEELRGVGTQSPTADIFSLGRLLFFLLLGRDPDEPLEEASELRALANQPAGLVRIVQKCTMRAPEARYQWVSDLILDIERYEHWESDRADGSMHEPSSMPGRVSSLPHATPWLKERNEARVAEREQGAEPGATGELPKEVPVLGHESGEGGAPDAGLPAWAFAALAMVTLVLAYWLMR